MKINQESIFTSSVRAFFVALFICLAIFVSLIPITIGIGALTGDDSRRHANIEVLPYYDNFDQDLQKETPLFLQLDIRGIIGEASLSTESIQTQLMDSLLTIDYERIRGVVLNIQTPGGTVIDSDGIYRAIKRYKEKLEIPIYAHVDGLCASGGVYAACAADKVFASPTSLVGSVGVLGSFINISSFLEKIGVQSLTLTAGKNKDLMNPARPWKVGETQAMQELLDVSYIQFVDIVINARPMIDRHSLIEEYGANVFHATAALEKGFIDGITKSLDITIATLAKDLDIESGDYQVIRLHRNPWFFNLLRSEYTLLRTGKIEHSINLPHQLPKAETENIYYLYRPN